MCVDCCNGDSSIIGPVSDMPESVRTANGITINEVTIDFDDEKLIIKRVGNNVTSKYKQIS